MKHIVGPWVISVFEVYCLLLLASVQILLFTLRYFHNPEFIPVQDTWLTLCTVLTSARSMHFRTFYKVLKS